MFQSFCAVKYLHRERANDENLDTAGIQGITGTMTALILDKFLDGPVDHTIWVGIAENFKKLEQGKLRDMYPLH